MELEETQSNVVVTGAMRNVMWKGELESSIDLDTISNREGLYGIGPVIYLRGELLINNGKSYISRVTPDSTMSVERTFSASAPFFVRSNVREWQEVALSEQIKTIADLEVFIDENTANLKRPFAFKLSGTVSSATIHIQNLPAGSTVSSPEEAHRGQTKYMLLDEKVDIIGFFSTEHQGVFTHHDTYLHMHLITTDERKMGHLDAVQIHKMTLYLPEE